MSLASWTRDRASGKIRAHTMPYRATKARNAGSKLMHRAENVAARRDANQERANKGGPGWIGIRRK